MKFENDFYRILKLEKADSGYKACVELIYPHEIYKGHFPDHPVVPGVCTLTILREILSGIEGQTLGFRQIRECKFVSALIPVPGLQAEFDVELGDDGAVKCVVRSEGRTIMKLKAVTGRF